MARYNIDEIINNANSKKKKKKRYDIDEILNNANNISKSSSITKTNIRLNNGDKNFWGNVGDRSDKILQEAIKVKEQSKSEKELFHEQTKIQCYRHDLQCLQRSCGKSGAEGTRRLSGNGEPASKFHAGQLG